MTFQDQVRFSRRWSLILFAASACLFLLFWVAFTFHHETLGKGIGVLLQISIFAAIFLGLFLGVIRPVQKRFYHFAIEASDRYRGNISGNPIMRWWVWLDSEGRDRDA